MYDFPASPTENQEFVPPVGGQTYIYKAPRWMVKGIPPIAGEGGGGGIDEAPVDGNQYARQDAAWSELDIPAGDWDSITGKPATFPPTVPIAWADISGEPATFPPTLPIPWTDVSGKPTTFPPTLPIAQADVTGLVAGQAAQDTAISGKAPTVHTHAQADVTNLTADLALKAPLASPIFTGDARAVTPATADNDTSIATTAHVQANMALKANVTHTHPQSDITNLTTDLGLKAPLAGPVFTGDARAVTPTAGDNDTSIATTAFVTAAVAAKPGIASVSDAAPGSPVSGQLWWNSANGNLYIWYMDGTSNQWVQINTVGA